MSAQLAGAGDGPALLAPTRASSRRKVKTVPIEEEFPQKLKGKKKEAAEDLQTEPTDDEVAGKKKTTTAKGAKKKTAEVKSVENVEPNMTESPVVRCFNNVASASDVKVELERLKVLSAGSNAEQFDRDFRMCVTRILAQYKTTSQITLCNDLIQGFVCSRPQEIQSKFLAEWLQYVRAKDKAVRLRSVNLIRLWLKAQSEIAEETHSSIVSVLMDSAIDKNPLVRQEAVAAFEFLQDPNNAEDKVIKLICTIADHDSIAKVRKTALRIVSPTERSIQTFVDRTRDESDEVRMCAWKEMEERFRLQWFSSDQLFDVLGQGLEDFSTSVRNQCQRTLLKWFLSEKHADVGAFLDALDVERDENFVFRVLSVLSPKVAKDKVEALTPASSLSKSASIWLRFCCEKRPEEVDISATALMESLEQILQVMRYSKKESPDNYFSCAFVAKQLVIATASLPMIHDPQGRANTIRVLSEALLVEDFPPVLVDPMVKAVKACFTDDSQFIVEVTTNILSFLSELSPLDQVRADIMKAEQLIDDYTRTKNYASLPTLVAEIEVLKQKEQALIQEGTDESGTAPASFSRLARSTALVCSVLRILPRTNRDSLLASLLDTCCVPAIQSPEVEARLYGVEALGLLALKDIEIAKSHGVLLARTFFENEREDLQVRLKALQILFDILTAFGKQASSDMDFDLLVQFLMGLLEVDVHPEIRFLAATGLTKLLYLGRAAYPGLAQCLLIVLFHPSTDLNPKVKQCLSTFFAEYKNSQLILQASEPLIEAIITPAEDSMCEDLPLDRVLERLTFLLRDQVGLQLDFAHMLLEKVAKHFDVSDFVKSLVKAVTSISFGKVEGSDLEEKMKKLRYSIDLVIRSRIMDSDKVAAKQLDKFAGALSKLDAVSADIMVPDETKKQLDSIFSLLLESSAGAASDRPKRSTVTVKCSKGDVEGDEETDEGSSSEDENE